MLTTNVIVYRLELGLYMAGKLQWLIPAKFSMDKIQFGQPTAFTEVIFSITSSAICTGLYFSNPNAPDNTNAPARQ